MCWNTEQHWGLIGSYLWVMLCFKIFLFPSLSQAVAREQGCRGRRGGARSPRRGPALAGAWDATNSASAAACCRGGAENQTKWGYYRDLKGILCFFPSLHAPTAWSKADGHMHSSVRRQWVFSACIALLLMRLKAKPRSRVKKCPCRCERENTTADVTQA